MSGEILVSAGPGELRAALVADGRLIDLIVERPGLAPAVGEIHLARVARVVAGIDAAFLDIAGGRTAFLRAIDAVDRDAGGGGGRREADTPPISRLVAEGEARIVQLARAGVGGKDPRVTTRIGLPGRRLVYMPGGEGVAVSRRIGEADERARLSDVMAGPAAAGCGFVLRTAAAGASAEALAEEAGRLRERWTDVEALARVTEAPALLEAGPPPVVRVLRDHGHDGLDRVVIDDRAAHAAALEFCDHDLPGLAGRIELHSGPEPLFEARGVEAEIEAALAPRVALPSGGGIAIEATQALVAVDVDTGRHTGRGRLAETALETNLEAARETARQLRLRNLGGLVVIDFVRMERADYRKKIIDELIRATRPDPAAVRVGAMTPFGLVELTRRRGRPPLADVLTGPCPACGGEARVASPVTLALAALRAVLREAGARPGGAPTLAAAPRVIEALEGEATTAREETEVRLGRALALRPEPEWRQERYEVVLA